MDQCQRKVDLTLHVSWGRVVVAWKVLTGFREGQGLWWKRWTKIREETETKTDPETDDIQRREIKKRDCQTFGTGKGSLHVLTCGL